MKRWVIVGVIFVSGSAFAADVPEKNIAAKIEVLSKEKQQIANEINQCEQQIAQFQQMRSEKVQRYVEVNASINTLKELQTLDKKK